MSRFNNMAIVTIAGKRQVRVNVSGKSMFFFDLPEWAKHVAIDCNGEVWSSERNPVQDDSGNSWLVPDGNITLIGKVGFINNWKDACISASSAAKEFDAFATDAFATGGFVKGDQLTVNADKDSGQCKVEDMPVSAKVMAVKDGYENWVDFYYVQNVIEIHDDTVTLLNRKRGFTAEVSFKRGTMVKWEK